MLVVLLRFILLLLIVYVLFRIFKYILSPKRKLEIAHEKKKFYYLDDSTNPHKNSSLTYKGVLFEGEKYLGTTSQTFDIVSIFIWPNKEENLQGLTREDFETIELRIKEYYPIAKIDWKSPIKEFMKKNQP